MNKDSIIDYLSYIILRLFGPLIRILPLRIVLFLGRCGGELFYYFDTKHKAIAYANIKTAFGDKLSPSQLSSITKEFYKNFGQNLIEIFMIPLVDKGYINKYISIEGMNYIHEAFKRGKGVILLGAHEGSWEIFNIITANLGFPFVLFVREQRYPHLNQLLNLYRTKKGCKIIQRDNGLKQLIQALKNNQAIGMNVDQGGRSGIRVDFFGKDASMAKGALVLTLKYDSCLIPVFFRRLSGSKIKIMIEPPFEIKRTGNLEDDIRNNLQGLVRIFERYIIKYPQEYLWTYKIWKYSSERNILILNDLKTGHLRQSQTVAKIVSGYLMDRGIKVYIDTLDVKFKSIFSQYALTFSSVLSGKYRCQGCLWCLKAFLRDDTYKSLISKKTDIVISGGSSIAPINFVISKEFMAKSIVIMRPSILSTKRFNLVIMPQHDNPPRRRNVVVTEGALNLIDGEYLKGESKKLITDYGLAIADFYIGLLIGGDTKNFHLEKDRILEVIRQIKSVSEKLNAHILVTTSRRTQEEIEKIVKEEFKDYPYCKLLIIANEKNLPFAVGGILGLSQLIVSSPESISMISEAVNSKKYVLVFKSQGLSKRHLRFLNYFTKNKYIYLVNSYNLSKTIDYIWMNRPAINSLKDNLLIKEAIAKIL